MNFLEQVTSDAFRLKDELFQKVASQALGRDFKIEDANRFEIGLQEGRPEVELISFDGLLLGKIEFAHKFDGEKVSYGWNFTPAPPMPL